MPNHIVRIYETHRTHPNNAHWRDRAKMARDKADRMRTDRSKRMALAMAEFYERVANRIEQSLREARK